MPDLVEQIEKWRALNEQGRELFGPDFADDFAAEVERLRGALRQAIHVIEELAEQQAMPDDWYREELDALRTLAPPEKPEEPK